MPTIDEVKSHCWFVGEMGGDDSGIIVSESGVTKEYMGQCELWVDTTGE